MWDVGLTRLDYLIGEETHLDGADLKQLVHLASLDAMRRAVADGLGAEGALVLQILLLLWKNRIQKRSETPYIIAIRDIDLETFLDLDEDRVREGLRQLLPFVRVDDLDLYLSGDIELSLEPLLKKDGRLADRLDLVWRTTHARDLLRPRRKRKKPFIAIWVSSKKGWILRLAIGWRSCKRGGASIFPKSALLAPMMFSKCAQIYAPSKTGRRNWRLSTMALSVCWLAPTSMGRYSRNAFNWRRAHGSRPSAAPVEFDRLAWIVQAGDWKS